MKAYEELLNYCRDEQCLEECIFYQDHVDIIRKNVTEINHLSDIEIATLWSEYSTNFHWAGWLTIVKTESFKHFKEVMIEKEHYEPMVYGEDFYRWKEKNDQQR